MLKYLAVALVSLGLVGCQSTKLDAQIEKNLPKICSGSAQIYSAFTIAAAAGEIPAKYVRKANEAYAALAVICRDPSSVNSSNAIVVAAQAYAALIAASKQR